eukprot:m.256751 g.256751  ORF g.256751 m.256751 type:complete len:229 (-) comp34662_c0_seq1:226-912(-)
MALVNSFRRFAHVGVSTARRCTSLVQSKSAHTLPPLPYAYDALEPVISKDIMELHHAKHHNTYVVGLNAAEEKYKAAESSDDVTAQIALQAAIKFNGGGHINHSIFWTNLAPVAGGGGGAPEGELLAAIEAKWGSFDNFKTEMSAATAAVQGSGWGWLGYSKDTGLKIATCANQDPLEATTGLTPLLGIDIWEHAYYLDYQNVRPNYLKAIWGIVNWSNVAERFEAAK